MFLGTRPGGKTWRAWIATDGGCRRLNREGAMGVFVRGLAVIVTLMTLVQHRAAAADDYPSRPVTLIAPWPAGGAVDTLCRIFAAKLTDRLGKSIIVENRPGAGSVLGVATAARAAPAAPDGYTLVMGGSAALATTVTV